MGQPSGTTGVWTHFQLRSLPKFCRARSALNETSDTVTLKRIPENRPSATPFRAFCSHPRSISWSSTGPRTRFGLANCCSCDHAFSHLCSALSENLLPHAAHPRSLPVGQQEKSYPRGRSVCVSGRLGVTATSR